MAKSINFLTETQLEVTDNRFKEAYQNMQGNILKGHGRDHATMLFIHFKPKKEKAVKKILQWLAENYVTSFYSQLWERERYKRNQIAGDTFGALLISAKGYDYLETAQKLKDKAFLAGMKNRKQLNDPEETEPEYKGEIHAMLLLADDEKERMDIKVGGIIEEIRGCVTIQHIEYGDAIRNANGDGLEHNGYVDGISQPLFLKDEVDSYKKHHNITGDKYDFNPVAAPGLVLINDPYVERNVHSYGSYFVFRKLEQNVRAFKHEEEGIGEELYGKKGDLKERAGALLVGRFEDGTPITIQGEDKLIGSGAWNNFNYDADPSGGKCPHFAHIRKTNPRVNNCFDEHTMARRGIPFGYRNVSTEIENIQAEQFPKAGVGLLFMSYQKSIVNQFEFIQAAANSKDDGGVDPVIGQNNPRPDYTFLKDPDMKPGAKLNHPFNQHIHFKGGEYFFAPSITYLKTLAE
jgi:Dyp-type peroxidase family